MFAGIKTIGITTLISFAWLSSAQAVSLNLDFGQHGAPASGFGAASGQAGVWNEVTNFVTNSGIVDTSGAATGVTVEITALTMSGVEVWGHGYSFDLMNDNFYTHETFGPWSLTISGLKDGLYDIYIYAPANTSVGTGAGSVNGVTFGEINGVFTGNFVEGSHFHLLTSVQVVAGLLTANASPLNLSHSGMAGLQLVPVAPVPVPAALPLFGSGLGLMGLFGWWKRRKALAPRSAY